MMQKKKTDKYIRKGSSHLPLRTQIQKKI